MLQQTQVNTVIPYYLRWMRRFPTLNSLARARESSVLKLWEGLGYYSRARNLQRAARIILKDHCGIFPLDYQTALTLPGVGKYTAGAVCSIAGNMATPIVDGNVQRVLCRLFNLDAPVEEKRVCDFLWKTAADYVQQASKLQPNPPRACGQANQALMELGATICVPVSPSCPVCPVQRFCGAKTAGAASRLPRKKIKPSQIAVKYRTLILEHQNRYLIRRRSMNGRNAGLWEFPNNGDRPDRKWRDFLREEISGAASLDLRHLFDERHSITRYRYEVRVFHGRATGPLPPSGAQSRWVRAEEMEAVILAGAHRRIWNRFRKIQI